MLKSITIKNYALIDSLTLEFGRGFNVFTGETGAGKSLIVGAMSLLAKGKVDSSVIKTGKDKAVIEGVFSIDDDRRIRQMLDEEGIDAEDELIIKRIISRDSSNSIRINGSSVTLNYLTKLLSPLTDIHSQKDSHYLFVKKNHLTLLDRYAGDGEFLKAYRASYEAYKKCLEEYEEMLNKEYSESEYEYLMFQKKELEDASLDVNEEEKLLLSEKNYKTAEKYLTNLGNVRNLYSGSGGIKEKLEDLLKQLNINDETLNAEKEKIESLYYELDDALSRVSRITDSLDAGEINIEKVEERLYLYSKLKRKYAKSTPELLEYMDEINKRINLYKDRDYLLNKKKEELDSLKDKALKDGKTLSDIRKKAALKLEEAVINETKALLLENIRFKADFKPSELTNSGTDDIEFIISLNRGEDLKPLKTVASGGESARVMLALKIIFARLSDTKLIIFDEIDAGISGKAALAVGRKIASLSDDIQVITITHLAPVAAYADDHYLIYKEDDKEGTHTKVKLLDDKDDIYRELSYLSSGNSSKESLEASRLLYMNAQGELK